MLELWNRLKGRKTYLLSLIGVATVLLKALADSLQDVPVSWPGVIQQVMAFLATMALRQGVAVSNQQSAASRS